MCNVCITLRLTLLAPRNLRTPYGTVHGLRNVGMAPLVTLRMLGQTNPRRNYVMLDLDPREKTGQEVCAIISLILT